MDGMGWLTIGAIHFAEYNFLIYEIRSDHMAKLGSVCVWRQPEQSFYAVIGQDVSSCQLYFFFARCSFFVDLFCIARVPITFQVLLFIQSTYKKSNQIRWIKAISMMRKLETTAKSPYQHAEIQFSAIKAD